jgi:hypothetical protein
MSSPGRNDPCPCGSGKKHKHCCLGRVQSPTGITRQDRTDAMEALLRYSRRGEFDDVVGEAALLWTDTTDDVQAALQDIFEFETSVGSFFEWLNFDFRFDDRRTLADRFLDEREWSTSPRAVDYIRLMRDTHLRAYQVRDVRPGEGISVRDLWTKDDFFITEHSASMQLVKWDVIVARVNTHADGARLIEGTTMALPPAAAKLLLKKLKAEYKSFARRHPDEPIGEFFKFAAPHFHDFWIDETALREPPHLTTLEGDDITLSELVFSVPQAGDALATLLLQPDFEPAEAGCAAWLEPGQTEPRILGEVRCDRSTLTLTTFSRQRAANGRARLVELLGPLVLIEERHRETGALSEDPHAPESDPEVPIESVPEVAEWQDRKDREWLDLAIPALDGRTPREASKDGRLRAWLRELLIHIENQQLRLMGGQGRDLTWMWKELGLRRP